MHFCIRNCPWCFWCSLHLHMSSEKFVQELCRRRSLNVMNRVSLIHWQISDPQSGSSLINDHHISKPREFSPFFVFQETTLSLCVRNLCLAGSMHVGAQGNGCFAARSLKWTWVWKMNSVAPDWGLQRCHPCRFQAMRFLSWTHPPIL